MKRKRHTPEQIIARLREADGMLGTGASIAQVCRKIEVSRGPRWNAVASHMNQAVPTRNLRQLGLVSILDASRRLERSN
jgi:hypothetical protein